MQLQANHFTYILPSSPAPLNHNHTCIFLSQGATAMLDIFFFTLIWPYLKCFLESRKVFEISDKRPGKGKLLFVIKCINVLFTTVSMCSYIPHLTNIHY